MQLNPCNDIKTTNNRLYMVIMRENLDKEYRPLLISEYFNEPDRINRFDVK